MSKHRFCICSWFKSMTSICPKLLLSRLAFAFYIDFNRHQLCVVFSLWEKDYCDFIKESVPVTLHQEKKQNENFSFEKYSSSSNTSRCHNFHTLQMGASIYIGF